MKLLSNAIIFKASLPDLESLATHLLEIPHTDIAENAAQCCGFIENKTTGEWVTPIEGGFAFQFQIDTKIMPADVIKKETDARIQTAERNNGGFPLKKKDKQYLKSEVVAMLLPTAMVRTKVINAFYDTESGYLIIDTARKALADVVISMLIKCCGSVKTETIHISDVKLGITAKLKGYLNDDDSFNGFSVGEFCKLVNSGEGEKKTYDGSDIESNPEKLIEDLDDGFLVSDIQLVRNGLKFKLTSNFEFKSFKFEPMDLDKDDKAWSYRHESAVKMLQIVDVVSSIVSLVEYK